MHNTIFDSTTAGLHFCHPVKFCCCPLAHHLAASCAVTRVLLKCVQQLLCSRHLSLVIVLGEAPLHIHRDDLANAHELPSHNPFRVLRISRAARTLCRRRKTPEMPPHSTTHRTSLGLTARPLRQASPPHGFMPRQDSMFLGETLALLSCASSSQPERPPLLYTCLLYTSPSPRDQRGSRMPSSA